MGDEKWARLSSMIFNAANVKKPLASAARVVEAGVLEPSGGRSRIENLKTGEAMELRVEKGVYVFDVMYEDEEMGVITLGSGAGVNVWPESMKGNIKMEPKMPGLRMMAANGTEIENMGQTKVRFWGKEEESTFSGPSQ